MCRVSMDLCLSILLSHLLPLSAAPSLTHSPIHSLSLTHSLIFFGSLSLLHTHTHTHTLSLFLTLAYLVSPSLSLLVYLCLSLLDYGDYWWGLCSFQQSCVFLSFLVLMVWSGYREGCVQLDGCRASISSPWSCLYMLD